MWKPGIPNHVDGNAAAAAGPISCFLQVNSSDDADAPANILVQCPAHQIRERVDHSLSNATRYVSCAFAACYEYRPECRVWVLLSSSATSCEWDVCTDLKV